MPQFCSPNFIKMSSIESFLITEVGLISPSIMIMQIPQDGTFSPFTAPPPTLLCSRNFICLSCSLAVRSGVQVKLHVCRNDTLVHLVSYKYHELIPPSSSGEGLGFAGVMPCCGSTFPLVVGSFWLYLTGTL